MKYLILMIAFSSVLFWSCSESSSDNKVVSENLGNEGYNCKDDGSCNTGLICNRNNICEKEEIVIDNTGKEGYECKSDNTCNAGLVCNSSNICEKEQVIDNTGKEGYECKSDYTCNYGLFCNLDNICEVLDVTDFGKEGKPCNLDYTCDTGLMCALEDICMNSDDFNTGDEGQDCRITEDSYDFCYDGLYCDTFGRCELDCSPGNDFLCTNDGMFDFSSNYASKYKIVKFDETTECGSNNYVPKTDVGYEYFELTYENFYGEFEYLAFHDCSSAFNCSSSEKSDYRIVEFDGQMLMEHAYKNDDGSCTYRSIDSKIRLNGDKVRLRYTFDEVTVQNYTDECSDSNVSNHYGEMECAKIRIIDGVME